MTPPPASRGGAASQARLSGVSPYIEKLRLLSSCVRAFCRPQAKVRRPTVRREGKSTRRALVESVILMPIATRRNPVDSAERARQDDLPTVDNRDEAPQDQPQPHTPSGAPSAGGGRSTSLFERMRSSFGGVDARRPTRR